MHPAGQVVPPQAAADISPDMTLRPLFRFAAILLGAACGKDDPTGLTAGERMTVPEQVAVGPALEKAARALDSTHRPADELLADWIRIGGGLVSRQGQHGRMTVRVQPRGGAIATLDMRGMTLRVHEGSARIHLLLAWEGLDVVQLSAQRVLVLLFTGTAEEGDLPGTGGASEGRWVDFTSGAAFPDPYLATSAAAAASGGAFGGSCPGVADTEDFSCTTGREAILAEVTVERSAQIIDIDWDAVVLPAFRIVGSVFAP
jgi:hypothetical protein